MRRVLVTAIPKELESMELDRISSHHLLQVLRLPRGSKLIVFDGSGAEAIAKLTSVNGQHAVIEIVQVQSVARHMAAIHLLLGMPKGPAMDLAVRMATEAGVHEIHPMRCERSVPKGDRLPRWEKIIVSACQQCGRADVPLIHLPATFDEVMSLHETFTDRRIALPESPTGQPSGVQTAVAIGPEGGFTDREIKLAVTLGYSPIGLGPYILRTDTAAAIGVAQATGKPA